MNIHPFIFREQQVQHQRYKSRLKLKQKPVLPLGLTELFLADFFVKIEELFKLLTNQDNNQKISQQENF
jgi:hypothetical protein